MPLDERLPSPSEPGGDERLPLVVILGPTAVGKTEIAIRLAERLKGEIVSADSRLFYLGMDIGTAKPTPEEQRRVPHHLIDIVHPDQTLSLAQFQDASRQAIAGIHARGRLPFLVGGTGQYIRAVTEGWQPPEVAPHPKLRAALEAWARLVGKQGMHTRLALLDPQAAAGIDYRNLRRTLRALEVIFATGERFSAQRRQAALPYRTLKIGLTRPRPELYDRVDTRIEAMFASGFVDEVRRLLDQGYPQNLPAFSAIGYPEVIACLHGKMTEEEAVAQIKRKTRLFVRRQANWFKSGDPEIHWFSVEEDTVDRLAAVIRGWLAG